MSPILLLVVALSILVGLSLGLLGGGGSILVVPLLVYIAGLEPREAIATSLVVVGATSLVSLIGHARRGKVQWRTGLLFGAAGMIGAFGGGLLGGRIPGPILMVAFAAMMLATAGAMLRQRKPGAQSGPAKAGLAGAARTDAIRHSHTLWRVLLDGLVVGAATGLVGAGGGFLVVPALVLLAGLPMSAAVGTSLLVIAMKSFAGFGGYLTAVSINWPLTAAVTLAAIAGSFVGVALTSRVPEDTLRRASGFFVMAMGVVVLAQELPMVGVAILLAVVATTVIVTGLVCVFAASRCPLRTRVA